MEVVGLKTCYVFVDSIVDFYRWRGWEDHKIGHKYMTPKLVTFYDVQISRI